MSVPNPKLLLANQWLRTHLKNRLCYACGACSFSIFEKDYELRAYHPEANLVLKSGKEEIVPVSILVCNNCGEVRLILKDKLCPGIIMIDKLPDSKPGEDIRINLG